MVQRGGEVRAMHVENTFETTLLPVIYENISKDAKVYTGHHRSYSKLERVYDHKASNAQ